jgi:hypothetical protein
MAFSPYNSIVHGKTKKNSNGYTSSYMLQELHFFTFELQFLHFFGRTGITNPDRSHTKEIHFVFFEQYTQVKNFILKTAWG